MPETIFAVLLAVVITMAIAIPVTRMISINKYKKVEYQAVEYAPTSEIIAELEELQKQIDEGLKALKGML